MKKILITEGTGSMARELAIILSGKGHKVYAYDIPVANFTGLDLEGITGIRGDITDPVSIGEAVRGMDIVIHLAALFPPISERSWETTYKVNVLGTMNLVDAIAEQGKKTRLVFSSTVATYGDTTSLEPPVTTETHQNPNSNFSRSKMEAEQYILKAGIPYTILRISGIVQVALMDPPAWPFIADQRVEYVYRGDVVSALGAAAEKEDSSNRILLISGGLTWQMTGSKFVKDFLEALDTPFEDAEFAEKPVYSDWYDTGESQRILSYQDTSFPTFLELLKEAVDVASNG